MNKNLFIIAATIGFAACSNETLIDEPIAQEIEIGFNTFAERQTKAENNSTAYDWNLEDHHLTFDVWSTKNVADEYIAVHGDGAADNAGVKVTWDGTKSVWSPAAKKYWDKAATLYRFYAAAPSSASWKIKNAKVTPATDPLTYIENYEKAYLTYANATLTGVNIADAAYSTTLNNSWKGKADVDLMIAAPCEKTGISDIKTTTDQTVTLQFNHILSRLNVSFKKSTNLNDAEVVVTDFQVCNLVSKGSFDESKAAAVNSNPGSLARWTPSTTATDIVDIQGVHTEDELSSTDAYYTVQSLVIPQNVAWESIKRDGTDVDEDSSKPYIYVEYEIDEEPFFAYVNLAAAFGMDGTAGKESIAFNEGWQNNLTVTLDALEILLDATVSEWSTNLNKEIEIK